MVEKKVNNSTIRLENNDLTAMDIEAIAFYAQHDLALGSGFGNAIAVRGGTAVQEELKELGPLTTGEAVVTSAGQLKSNYIVHAVGPRFQEADMEEKLKNTMRSALNAAKEKGIKKIAFPPMGSGFYGIPLPTCADIMVNTCQEHLAKETSLENVVICVMDEREYNVFQSKLNLGN